MTNFINHIVFTRMIVSLFYVFTAISLSYSQVSPINSQDSINSRLNNAELLLKKNNPKSYLKGIEKINKLEREITLSKNSNLICNFYIKASEVFLNRYDLSSAQNYINKGLKIAQKYKNNEKIGFFYENLGVIYNFYEQKEKRNKYFYLAKYYLSKYAPLSSQSDIYYNLAYINLDKKDWKSALRYALKCDSITRFVKKSESDAGIILVIAESYVKLKNLKETSKYINLINISEIKKENDFKTLNRYYNVVSEILFLKKDFKEAFKMQTFSNDYNTLIVKRNIRKINENLAIQSKMQLLMVTYEKQRKEAFLLNKNNQYQKFILLLASIIILVLIFILFLQIRNSKFKTKVNLLLKSKNIELKQAIGVKKQFINSFSHELRTPLNAIKNVSNLLLENKNKDENISILQSSTEYLINLTNQIIEYNLINERKKTFILSRDTIHLKQLSEKIIDSVKTIHKENNNQFHLNFDDKISNNLIFDQNRLKIVLNSILDNAFKFTNNGNITMTIKALDNQDNFQKIFFEIEDSGIGIENESILKVFNLFYQGSEKINIKYGGSGIGLTIAKNILDLISSNININSKINEGTVVNFDIIFEKGDKSVTDDDLDMSINSNEDNCVLIVEDNKINQLLLSNILVKNNISFDIAENGKIATEMVQKKHYSLIFMDIMMPVMDGFEASKIINNMKLDIQIVAVTAISEEVNKEKFEESGINTILSKPIDQNQIKKLLNQFCQ